jgi:hypothetical protein
MIKRKKIEIQIANGRTVSWVANLKTAMFQPVKLNYNESTLFIYLFHVART